MTIHAVLIGEHDDPAGWREALAAELPGLELTLHVWPQLSEDAERISIALAWKPPPGALAGLPGLRLIQCLGMGVDALFDDPELPTAVPIARLHDPDLIAQMSEYVCWAVLHHHRKIDAYLESQRRRRWRPLPATDAGTCRVGILGLGAIGSDCAVKLRGLGFPVSGWSRSAKTLDGVDCYHGRQGLNAMLPGCRVLVCLLPLTPDTAGIVDAELLARLPRGALLVNIARGGHVVDLDLLAALESGGLGGAVLDVCSEEPLRIHHPYWDHPRVKLTPHIAGLTRPTAAAGQIATNIRRVMAGQPPVHQVSRERGY